MPNLQELLDRRTARRGELSKKEQEKRDAAEDRKRAKFRDKQLGTAVGATVNGGRGFGTVIAEISQILDLIDDTEKSKQAFRGDAETIAVLDADLKDQRTLITELAAGVEDVNFLICLADMSRSEPTIPAIRRFAREGVEKFHVLAELDEVRARERAEVLRQKKAGEIEEIPAEHKGMFWWLEHNNTTSYFVTVRFSPDQKTEIAQASAFADYFGNLFHRFRDSRKEMSQNLAHLDHEATLTLEQVDAGEVGLMKMAGLFHVDFDRERQKKAQNAGYVEHAIEEDNCWRWIQRGRDGAEDRELHAWGVWYLRVKGPGRAVPEVSNLGPTHRLRKTMQHMSVGLLEADGRPKEITFKPNFTNVRAARGFTPLSQPAKTGDFLRQSIGLKVKPVEDVPAPSLDEGDDVPTDMAVAMQAATEKKRGGKKNSRSRSSDKE